MTLGEDVMKCFSNIFFFRRKISYIVYNEYSEEVTSINVFKNVHNYLAVIYFFFSSMQIF